MRDLLSLGAGQQTQEPTLRELLPLLRRLESGEVGSDKDRKWLDSIRIVDSGNEQLINKEDRVIFTDSDLWLLCGWMPALISLSLTDTDVRDIAPLKGLKNLVSLDLSSTQISDITALKELKNLKELDLHSTQISDITVLKELKNLNHLELTSTQISDITALKELKDLKLLDLSSTQISDITALKELKDLKSLYLSSTQISDITALKDLKNLEFLNLSSTQISDITALKDLKKLKGLSLRSTSISDIIELKELKNLEILELSFTKISDITHLNELTNMHNLYLSSTQVNDLTPLEKLKRLTTLDIENLQLDIIPRFCVREGLILQIKDTTFSRQPEALFHLPTKQILSTYYDVPHVKINEGKVIFLGDPAVGKTYTIQRIRSGGVKQEFDTRSTPGVDIQLFDYGDGIHVRFWDFGGQEIMQSMHHCFLTERTCYVVVVNNRTSDSPMSQARRWLRTVAGFSQHVSVLLLVNQWSSVAADSTIDSEELKNICPTLADVVFYSAADDPKEHFNRRVTDKIRQEVDRLDSIKLELPQSWASIREEMLGMKVPYISVEEYRDICSRHGLDGKDKDSEAIRMWLLEWLNDMGICFSYHKNAPVNARAIKDYKVLQPKWLTEGIYRIIYNGSRCTASGFVRKKDLQSMLLLENESYLAVDKSIHFEREDFNYILEVMRKFGRSFDHGDEREFIPETLSDQRPENQEPREQGFETPVTYTLKLTYLPLGLIHHLMIKLFAHCDGVIWRRGMRLRDEDTVLIVEGEPEQPLVHFHLYRRTERKWDYCLLFHQTRQLALDYIKDKRLVLEKETVHITKNEAAAVYPLKTIMQAWGQGEDTPLPYNEGAFALTPVKNLLYPLFPKEIFENSMIRVFAEKETTVSFWEVNIILNNLYHLILQSSDVYDDTWRDKYYIDYLSSHSKQKNYKNLLKYDYYAPESLHETGNVLRLLINKAATIYPYATAQTIADLPQKYRVFKLNEKSEAESFNSSLEMLPPQIALEVISLRNTDLSQWLIENGTLRTELLPNKEDHDKEEGAVWDRKEIRGINLDLIQWAVASPIYKKAIGDADTDQEQLVKALGQNEGRRYEGSFTLMQAIWQSHPELGLAPEYMLLTDLEYGRKYYTGYRDHTTHMFKVFLLGLYLYEKSERIRNAVTAKNLVQEDFLSVWILTALFHDIGYVIETEDGCWDSAAGKAVIVRFNEHLAHPMSHLFSEVMDIGTEDAIQIGARLKVDPASRFDIEQKMNDLQDIGPVVKLSNKKNENAIKAYYEYASSKRSEREFYDHGIISAIMLLYSCEAVCDYLQKVRDDPVSLYPEQLEKLDAFINYSEKYKRSAKIAAQAIAVHNIQKNWKGTEITELNLKGVTISSFCIPLEQQPIAYLLRVCDELQCWDRQSFSSPLGKTRTPLEQDKLCFIPRPSEVDLSIKDAKKRAEIERALEGVLDPPLSTILELKG